MKVFKNNFLSAMHGFRDNDSLLDNRTLRYRNFSANVRSHDFS